MRAGGGTEASDGDPPSYRVALYRVTESPPSADIHATVGLKEATAAMRQRTALLRFTESLVPH